MKIFNFTLSCLMFLVFCQYTHAQQFAPTDIPDISLWLRSDTLLKDSSNFVTRWNNIVDTGIVFRQTTIAARPVKTLNVLNGKQVLRFDGSNDFLSAGDTLDQRTSSRTIFVVGGKLAANASGAYIAKSRTGSVPNRFAIYADNTGLNLFYFDISAKSLLVNPPPAKMNILSTTIDRSTQQIKLFANSTQIGTTASGIQNATYDINSTNRLLIGASSDANDINQILPYNGDIAEILFYNRALSDLERSKIEQYLRFRYAAQINLGPDTLLVNGFCNTTLNAGSNFTNYLWSTGATTSSISTRQPGKYWVSARDIFGYTTTDTIVLRYVDIPKPLADTSVCLGDTLILNPGISQITYSYLWSNGETTPFIKATTSGSYSVRVSDGTCFYYDTVSVALDLYSLSVSLGPDTSLCSGNPIGLTSGAANTISYLWGAGQNTSTIPITVTGSYTLTTTNIAGCKAKDTVTVTVNGSAPSINFTANNVCTGNPTSFSEQISIQPPAILASQKWFFTPMDSSILSNPTFLFPNPGSFNVSLTVSTNLGCATTITKSVFVKSKPTAAFNLLADACINKSYTFTSITSPGDTIVGYDWNLGDNTVASSPQTTHTYSTSGTVIITLAVQNSSGCVDTLKKPLNIVSTAPPTGKFTLTSPVNSFIAPKNTPVAFMWSRSLNAQSYSLQIATDSLFTSIVDSVTNISGSSASVNTLTNNTYFWRVIAYNLCGQPTISQERWKFTLLDLNSNNDLSLWLKSDSLLKDSSSFITRWNNVVDTGIVFRQTTGNFRPIKVLNTLNGKPVIRFDGTNDFLSATDTLDQGLSSRTIFVVGGKLGSNANGAYIAKSRAGGATPNRFALYSDNTGLNFFYYDNSAKSTLVNPAPAKMNIISTSIDRVTQQIKMYAGGNQVGTTVNGIQNSTYDINSTYRLLLGASSDATDAGQILPLNGDIAEVLFYNSALSDQERNKVEQYLRFKYAPQANLGPDTVITYGFCKLTLNPGNLASYLWSTGATTQTIDVNTSGTYWVRAQDIFGYTTTDTINISYQSVSRQLADTILCIQDTAVLNPGINGSYTFLWSTGQNTSTIKAYNAGTYSVKVTDNFNCTYNDTVIVSLDSFSRKISLGADSALCSGNTIGLQYGSGLPAKYLWNNNDTTSTIVVTNPGNYSLYTTNNRGCIGKDTISVTIKGIAPSINFTSDSACFRNSTSFIEQISISPPATFSGELWKFTPADSSTAANPRYTFPSAGNFNVSFTVVTNVGCNTTIQKNVFVKANPIAAFNLTTDACANSSYIFQSNSSAASGDVLTAFKWNFGDGNSGNTAQVSHSYISAGSFDVQLIVSGQNTCSDTTTRTLNVVSTAPLPQAFNLISPLNGFVSEASLPVTFTWTSSTNAQLYTLQLATDASFNNIINSTTGIQSNSITILSLASNTYYWRVIAANICGQQFVGETRTIKILNLQDITNMSLWIKADSMTVDSSGMIKSWINIIDTGIKFIQKNSSSRPIKIANVLNGKPAIRFDGTNDFLSAGDTLDIGNQSRTFFVVAGKAGTTSTGSIFAKSILNGVPNRIALVTDNTGLNYVFHDATNKSIIVNPAPPKINILSSTIDRSALQLKLFSNSVLISSNSGIQDVSYNMNSTTRLLLGAYGNATDNGEVLPLNGDVAEMIFYNKALSDQERTQVEQYLRFKYAPQINLGPDISIGYGACDTALRIGNFFSRIRWNTGDTSLTIKVKKAGKYWVSALDYFGYVTSDTINVAVPYSGITPALGDTICLGSSTSLQYNITGSPYRFLWSNGDTTASTIVSTEGKYSVLVSDTNGCIARDTVTILVDSISLLSILNNDTTTCKNTPLGLPAYKFPYKTYNWSTGSSSDTTILTVSGSVSVTVTDIAGCSTSDTINVLFKGIRPNVDFTGSNTCLGDSSIYTDNSQALGTEQLVQWLWNFGNGDTALANINQNQLTYYSTSGTYITSLTVVTDSGCSNSISKSFRVNPRPAANFIWNIACAGSPTNFVDRSTIAVTDTISSWEWDINGTSSLAKNPGILFPSQGEFNTTLIVTTNAGCADTVSRSVEVFAPLIADFDAGSVCLGDTLNFKDKTQSFSVINWLWNFGDNSPFALTQNASHKYLAAGTYEAVLKIENSIGCKDSVAKNVVVVAKPNADFNSTPACLGQPISLSDNSQSVSEPVVKWSWIINGQKYNSQSPSVLFADTGLYDAKLIVETGTGCKDSITRSLSVKPLPNAAFTFTPLYGEAPVTASFTNISTGANSYLWDFGDSSTDTNKNTSHTYQSNADFIVTLNATSSFGCVDSAKKQFTVRPTNLNLLVEDISTLLVQQGNGSLIQTSVRLANVGTRLITNASLFATLGNNGIVTEEWNGLLQPGQIILYTFNSRFVLSANNDKTYVCVEAVSVNNGEEESSIADNRSCTTIDGKAKVIGPYPNPANGDSKIGFVLAKSDVVTVNIFDTYGHSNYNIQQTLPKGRTDITLPTSGMMAGTYYVKVQFADDNYLIKLVVTN